MATIYNFRKEFVRRANVTSLDIVHAEAMVALGSPDKITWRDRLLCREPFLERHGNNPETLEGGRLAQGSSAIDRPTNASIANVIDCGDAFRRKS